MALNKDQVQYLVTVSMATRIDPRVIIAWMAQEGAFSGKESGKYNYLNIMDASHHPASFASSSEAAKATIQTLRMPQYKTVLGMALAKPTPKQQIAAIAASPWDQSHYGGNGGINLQKTFASMFGGNAGLNDSYVDPGQARPIGNTAGTGDASAGGLGIGSGPDPIGTTPSVIRSGASAVNAGARHIPGVAQIEDVGSFFKWVGGNWDRIGIVFLGVLLTALGLIFVFQTQIKGGVAKAAMSKAK